MIIAQEKIAAAYQYLIDQGLLPSTYFDECRRDLETGNLFWRGVPAHPVDASRAIEGLVSRATSTLEMRNNGDPSILKNPKFLDEMASLEELSARLMVLKIPLFLDWEVPQKDKGEFALLLGTAWNDQKGRLTHYLSLREEYSPIRPETIAGYILTAPLNEFTETETLTFAHKLHDWLSHKVEWRAEKETRDRILDRPNAPTGSGGRDVTLFDRLADSETGEETSQKIDRHFTIEKFLQILPPKEKAAVTKFLRDKDSLTPTERKAKDRAVVRIKEYCKKYRIEPPW